MNARPTVVVRVTNWLGDAVMSLPALRMVRRCRPKARVLVAARSSLAAFYRWIEGVDGVVPAPPKPPGNPRPALLAWARDLRRERPDEFVCFPNSFESALLGRLSGAPLRFGYATDGRGWLLNRRAGIPADLLRRHQVHYYLAMLRETGFSHPEALSGLDEEIDMRIERSPEMRDCAIQVLRRLGWPADGPVVGIHAGAFFGAAKRWPADRFSQLIRQLLEQLPARVALLGAPGERPLADEILSGLPAGRVGNLCGRTALDELVALLSRLRLLVSNDSGPMHVAAALRVPQVALFGSTDPVATGPFSPGALVLKKPVECSPCFRRECPLDLRCFTSIPVDEVAAACARIYHMENSSEL